MDCNSKSLFSSNELEQLYKKESQSSWFGTYNNAQHQQLNGNSQFKHVTDICAICLENYQPIDQIQVLPCAHAFHHKCFKLHEQSSNHSHCPLDQNLAEWQKITLLGRTILFHDKNQFWIYKFFEPIFRKIETEVENFKKDPEKYLKEYPTEIFIKEREELETNLKKYLQESSTQMSIKDKEELEKNQEKYLQEPSTQISKKKDGEELEKKLTKAMELFQIFIDRFARNYRQKIESFPLSVNEIKKACLELGLNPIEGLRERAHKDINIDIQGALCMPQLINLVVLAGLLSKSEPVPQELISYLISCFRDLRVQISQDPDFISLAQEADKKFYIHHRQALEGLSSSEQNDYLKRMKETALVRLNRIPATDTSSIEIKQKIALVQRELDVEKKVRSIFQCSRLMLISGLLCFLFFSLR
jgi:hypothetical protein